jgi:site-specific recombinase XerD
MSILKLFVVWVDVPLEAVTPSKVLTCIDWLLSKRLKPKTINCHLACISGFYQYLYHEKGITITNPVKQGYMLRMSKPLPRFVRDEKLDLFLQTVKTPRDYAMFMVMLRCGLRVAETAHLTLAAIDLPGRQIMVCNGKGGKDRVVYISNDAHDAIVTYLQLRPAGKVKKLFLVEKGPCRGKPLSVRGIQKRMEYYARKAALPITCHQLRHTMATQLLNADAELASIQDLLGHNKVTTTQRYCKVSNRKVQRDYFKAMAVILQSTVPGRGDIEALDLIK